MFRKIWDIMFLGDLNPDEVIAKIDKDFLI